MTEQPFALSLLHCKSGDNVRTHLEESELLNKYVWVDRGRQAEDTIGQVVAKYGLKHRPVAVKEVFLNFGFVVGFNLIRPCKSGPLYV